MGEYGDSPNFWSTPYYLRNGYKATNFKFGRYIQRAHTNKSRLKIWEKLERRRIQGLPNFFCVPPIISGTGKATNFNFCRHILSINRNKSLEQISGKVARCVVRSLKTFQGTDILGASRGLLCNSSAVLLDSTFLFIFGLHTFPFRLHILVGLHAYAVGLSVCMCV